MARQKFTTQKTLSALALYDSKSELSIPKVQRDLVWTLSQKQLLIDSIIKDYDIPKLYFREVNEDGKKYEIINGQQRLNAILSFMRDEFSLPADADPYQGVQLAGVIWSQMSSDLQIEFSSRTLDIVILQGYTDEETDETFLRLQNGTPLKAPEKRRAIQGNMREVVEELSKSKIFELCDFSDAHYAYEDVTAKALRLLLHGGPTSITAKSLSNMYRNYSDITVADQAPKNLKKAYSFLVKAFKNECDPHFKKYAVVDLVMIVSGLLSLYDLNSYAPQFAKAYLDFQNRRVLNNEKPEDEQDPRLLAYSNAARGDSLEYIQYRQDLLREFFLQEMPYLKAKDEARSFTAEQRDVIYRLGDGKCAICGKHCSEEDFEADHITPWSKGGATQVSNGQILCVKCNRQKSDKILSEDGEGATFSTVEL